VTRLANALALLAAAEALVLGGFWLHDWLNSYQAKRLVRDLAGADG